MSDVVGFSGRLVPVVEQHAEETAADAVLAAALGVLDGSARADVALMDGPHILVCTDSETGTTTYTGPYGTGYDALAHLEDHEAGQQPRPGVRTVVCTLAPLLSG